MILILGAILIAEFIVLYKLPYMQLYGVGQFAYEIICFSVLINTIYDNRKKIKLNILLDKKLVAGTQISKVHSKYWWNNELEECDEYKLEFRTKESLFGKIETEIKKIHNYEVAEISYIEIKDGSKAFLNWIDSNIE